MILFKWQSIPVWFDKLFRVVLVALIVTAFNVTGCVKVDPGDAYHRAVVDAAFPEKDEITSKLIPIVKGNRELRWNADESKILVCTWKSLDSYEKFLKPYNKTPENLDHVIWVTTVPQVRHICSGMFATDPKVSEELLELRIKQYLGLNPDWQYDVFVEMWVDPADLFRPCVDPQVVDDVCNLHFGEEIPRVKNVADYRASYEIKQVVPTIEYCKE